MVKALHIVEDAARAAFLYSEGLCHLVASLNDYVTDDKSGMKEQGTGAMIEFLWLQVMSPKFLNLLNQE